MDLLNTIYLFLFFINFSFFLFIRLLFKKQKYYKKISIKINKINYNTTSVSNNITGLAFNINTNLIPTIKINNLNSYIIGLGGSKSNEFSLWKSPIINDIFLKVNHIISSITKFNIYIKFAKINYTERVYVKIYGLNIYKITGDDFKRLKIGTLKLYIDDKCMGRISNFKMTLKVENPTIYIGYFHILFIKKLLEDHYLNIIRQLYLLIPTAGKGGFPQFMIKQFRMNVYLHNYIQINTNNMTIEEGMLNIFKTSVKIWKKESIWCDNLNMDLNGPLKSPTIQNIRIRLFNSTGDKLYKTLIILRKKFMPITPKTTKKHFPRQDIKVNKNYLQLLDKKREISKISIANREIIIQEYLTTINDFITQFKISIINLEIKLSINDGIIRGENIIFSNNESLSVISIKSWEFSRKNILYISKKAKDSERFIINYNKKLISIIPYKMNIYFDVFWFKKMSINITQNINRLGNLFYSNFYIYNKGYVYESFRIESFSAVLNYQKTKRDFLALITGHKSQLLNYIEIEDLNILLNEVSICYPKDWDSIIQKVGKIYKTSIYENNIKSIITKISGEGISSVVYLKKNLQYLKNKIINTAS